MSVTEKKRRKQNMWNRIKSAKWFIPVIVAVIVGVLATVGIVAAAWSSKTVPATGTIQITATTPAPDYNFTLSTPVAFGSNSFACGASISITGTVTVSNTGNQPINSLAVACSNLPNGGWITDVAITQTPIPAGGSQLETITLSGTAPSSPVNYSFVGAIITITPSS
jgi:hypothetical protein